MTTTTSLWRNHTKSSPCPVCGKHDRCKFTEDGAHRCFRSKGDVPNWKRVKTCRDGTGIYRDPLRSVSSTKKALRMPQKNHVEAQVTPPHDWAAESVQFTSAITDAQLNDLAMQLGVTPESLRQIDCGWVDEADLHRLNAFGKDWAQKYPTGAYSFPERDSDGTVIGLSFRAVDGSKGAPKGARRGLIISRNFDEHAGLVVVVEGASDVAACLTMGIMAVGRPSNTSGAEHLAVLLAETECLVVGENDLRLNDGGAMYCPGREGAESVSTKLATEWGRAVNMAMPPKGSKDVRAWLNAQALNVTDAEQCCAAGERLMAALNQNAEPTEPSPPKLEFQVEDVRNRVRSNIRVLVDDQIAHVDSINLNDSKARSRVAAVIAGKDPRFTAEMVEEELLRRVSNDNQSPDVEGPLSRADLLAQLDERVEVALDSMPEEVVAEAKALAQDPKLVNSIVSDIQSMGVVGERELALTLYLVGTSRLLDQPLLAMIQGTTSSGKSFNQKQVSLLFPDESVFSATDLTPNSLYYLPNGGLIHRFVVAGERSRNEGDDLANAKKALREMLSGGELSKAMPIKNGGRMETVLIRQYGPIAYVESTTRTEVFDEDMNRCLPLSTDESPNQTRQVMAAIARQARGDKCDVEPIMLRHHAYQRILKRVEVHIPYAEQLAEAMPSDRPEGRRAVNHAFNTVRSIALLHQYQRLGGANPRHGDIIEATVQDYVVARRLLSSPLGRALGGDLPDAVANLGRRVHDRYGDQEYSTTQAASDDPIIKSRSKISEYLGTLDGAGVVELVEKGKGSKPSIWLNKNRVPDAGARWLPDAAALQGVETCLTV